MKNDELMMMGAGLIVVLMLSKKSTAATPAAVTPTSIKPAVQGANLATMGQYWTNLLGPQIGAAVANNSFSNEAWSNSAQVRQQRDTAAAAIAGYQPDVVPTDENSTYWGIE